MLENSFSNLSKNPHLTPTELAQIFVNTYIIGNSGYTVEGWCSLVGVKTSYVDNIKFAIDNLSKEIIKNYYSNPVKIRYILKKAFKESRMIIKFVDKNFNQMDPLAHDIFLFTKKIGNLSKNKMPSIYQASLNVIAILNSSSIIRPQNITTDDFQSISIFSPPFNIIYLLTKKSYRSIDFSKQTSWDELLNLYYFRGLLK
jgi:hypothetical protein